MAGAVEEAPARSQDHRRLPQEQPHAHTTGCRTFTLLCKKLDLFGAELVAIDGSKFRAVNAKERNFTPAKLTKLLAQIDERVDASLKELDRQDTQEDRGTSGGAVAEHLQAKIEALQQRKLLYEGFQAQLEASGAAQLSLTDPESRAMKLGKGGGIEVCYNVQTAVDSQHKLIIANDVTNATAHQERQAAGRRHNETRRSWPLESE
jgi:hypothetical protein